MNEQPHVQLVDIKLNRLRTKLSEVLFPSSPLFFHGHTWLSFAHKFTLKAPCDRTCTQWRGDSTRGAGVKRALLPSRMRKKRLNENDEIKKKMTNGKKRNLTSRRDLRSGESLSLVACQRQTKLSISWGRARHFFFLLFSFACKSVQKLWKRVPADASSYGCDTVISYQTVRRHFVSFIFDSFSCPSVLLHETTNYCLHCDLLSHRQRHDNFTQTKARRATRFSWPSTDRRHVLLFFFFLLLLLSMYVLQYTIPNGFD